MNWHWMGVDDDCGRAVRDELGLELVVVVERGARVAFPRLGEGWSRIANGG